MGKSLFCLLLFFLLFFVALGASGEGLIGLLAVVDGRGIWGEGMGMCVGE